MNWKIWKIGIVVAFFTSVADTLSVYVAAETIIWAKVIAFSIVKGMAGAAMYMKQHPVEQVSFDTSRKEKDEMVN